LALAVREAGRALATNLRELDLIVNELVPGLTQGRGIGPVSAAQATVSFSHAGRCRSEAAYAELAGTSPIEVSSGQTERHRPNRGGDRALNKAIHTIALARMRDDPATKAYAARRRGQGKVEARDPPLHQASQMRRSPPSDAAHRLLRSRHLGPVPRPVDKVKRGLLDVGEDRGVITGDGYEQSP
jgi:transposase